MTRPDCTRQRLAPGLREERLRPPREGGPGASRFADEKAGRGVSPACRGNGAG